MIKERYNIVRLIPSVCARNLKSIIIKEGYLSKKQQGEQPNFKSSMMTM